MRLLLLPCSLTGPGDLREFLVSLWIGGRGVGEIGSLRLGCRGWHLLALPPTASPQQGAEFGELDKTDLPLSLFWQYCLSFFKKVCDPSRVAFSDHFLLHRVPCRLLSSPLLWACCSAREGVSGLCGVVFIRVLKDRAVGDLKKKKKRYISISGCFCMCLITWPLESNLD